MKKILNITIIALALAMSITSCKDDYLDINKNPNDAIYSSPELVLPGALTSTASLLNSFNDYGAFVGGNQANAYGYSYVGSDVVTYNYTANSNTGLFTNTYANLKNYQYIINKTAGVEKYVLFNAVARIMKSHNYQLLVDEYGDVPYTEAVNGVDNLTPKYDKAADVYKACVAELDAAIVALKAFGSNTSVNKLGAADIMFAGNATKWIQFANSIKLRFLVRAQNSSLTSFVNTAYGTFSSEGFLTEDAIVNPGYSSSSANQNPQWNAVHSDYTGVATGTGKSRVPTPYVVGFYNGAKLSDTRRGTLVYKSLAAPLNQLGVEPTSSAASAPTSGYPAWYTGTGTGKSATEAQGVLKSKVAGSPIMLAAEVNFLLAEAALNGRVLAGSDLTNFNKGIENSFRYLEKFGSTNAVPSTSDPVADATAYIAANTTSYLANYAAATTTAQKLEAIITQKYIALNYIHSHESWNESRRTGFPKTDGTTSSTNFASVTSISTRADKLPVRLLYPQSEINLNSNVPKGLSPFTSLIFWDAN